jgi:hypothetical protein
MVALQLRSPQAILVLGDPCCFAAGSIDACASIELKNPLLLGHHRRRPDSSVSARSMDILVMRQMMAPLTSSRLRAAFLSSRTVSYDERILLRVH